MFLQKHNIGNLVRTKAASVERWFGSVCGVSPGPHQLPGTHPRFEVKQLVVLLERHGSARLICVSGKKKDRIGNEQHKEMVQNSFSQFCQSSWKHDALPVVWRLDQSKITLPILAKPFFILLWVFGLHLYVYKRP